MARTLRAVVIAVIFQLGYSQDVPGAPTCADTCTKSALSAVGCAIVDLSCRCGPPGAAAALQAGACLLGSCNPSELGQLSSANSVICSSFNMGFVTKLATTTTSAAFTQTTQAAGGRPAPAAAGPSAQGRESTAETTSSSTDTYDTNSSTSSTRTFVAPSRASTQAAAAAITTRPYIPLGLGDPGPGEGELVSAPVNPNATSGFSAMMSDEGARAAIGLGGALSGALGFGSVYLAMMRRKRQQEQARLKKLADKEAPPIDELAEFVRNGGGGLEPPIRVDGDEKKARHKTVNLTPEGGPLELEVPAMPQELPGALLRHEMA